MKKEKDQKNNHKTHVFAHEFDPCAVSPVSLKMQLFFFTRFTLFGLHCVLDLHATLINVLLAGTFYQNPNKSKHRAKQSLTVLRFKLINLGIVGIYLDLWSLVDP